MALLGDDTSALDTYTDDRVAAADLIQLRDAVRVRPTKGISATATPIVVRTQDHRELEACVDVGQPATDLELQRSKLEGKFRSLVAPLLGEERSQMIVEFTARAEELTSVAGLVAG